VAHNMVTGATIDFFAPPRFGVGSQAAVSPDALGRYVVVFATDALDPRFSKAGIFVHDRVTQCLLNWAEVVVPSLFTPPTGATQLLPPYTFRAYASAYLGISVTDDHAWLLVPSVSPAPVDEGAVSNFLDNSGCR
jgi:hypothetical protein